MPNLLVEIYSEEIPSRFQKSLSDQLKKKLLEELQELKLPCGNARSYSSPQRMTIVIKNIPWKTAHKKVETRGPRVGAPDKAVYGFLKSKNKGVEDLEVRTIGKGEYYFITEDVPGTDINGILQQAIVSSLKEMSLPKSMYWGTERTKWVRPIQAMLGILYDKEKTEIVPFEYAGLTAGNTTYGHRFMAPEELTINSFEDYQSKLLNSFVIIDPESRKAKIITTIENELSKQQTNLELVQDEELLDEISGLVEWPVPLLGTIFHAFYNLPDEVLKTTIKVHQKYLSVRDTDIEKITNFIAVANFQAIDDGKTIINGNQRVLASRLSDALFFLYEDLRKFPVDLVDVTEDLRNVRYSYGLGTQKDRVDRIEILSRKISSYFACSEEDASLAARLAKIDLVTLIVKEFPELQGVMGRYYSQGRGIDPRICEAIEEHYLPAKTSDIVPSNPLSITIGLADRVNHLVGFFLRREVPTGLGDPNALRRAALGLIRLIQTNKIQYFNLRDIITFSVDQHFRVVASTTEDSKLELKTCLEEKEEVTENILVFILRRLSIYLKEKGLDPELVDACIYVPNNDNIYEIVRRIEALESFLPTNLGKDLLHLDKRIAKILISLKSKGDEDNSSVSETESIDPTLLQSSHEEALFRKYQNTLATLSGMENDNYLVKLQEVASLRKTIDDYFDNVMINVDDQHLKNNRLNLLAKIRNILAQDFNLRLISDQRLAEDIVSP